jgi:hypothetical protein
MNHIFQQPKQNNETKYYCFFGKEDYIDEEGFARAKNSENQEIIAKAVSNKKPKHFSDNIKHYRYYVKMSPNMELFNPISLYSTSSNNKQEFSHINRICKDSWIFKEVDKNIFDKYLLFLKTKNMQTFKDIQRQLK